MDEAPSADTPPGELEQLHASRARIATTADAEHRRIERALHDGVQQDLIALSVNLQLARLLLESDDRAGLDALLDELQRDLHEALESVNTLAYSVYPSLLLDRGLVEALRGAAARASVPTRIEADGIGRYPPDVEAAVYFCCVDALGAARGKGARATVRVWPEPGTLSFEIVLEGSEGGSDTAGPATTIGDRLGAVGGRLDVNAGAGVTRFIGAIAVSS